MRESIKLYSNLSWLWRMWGDPEEDYAPYNRYVMSWLKWLQKRHTGVLSRFTEKIGA